MRRVPGATIAVPLIVVLASPGVRMPSNVASSFCTDISTENEPSSGTVGPSASMIRGVGGSVMLKFPAAVPIRRTTPATICGPVRTMFVPACDRSTSATAYVLTLLTSASSP